MLYNKDVNASEQLKRRSQVNFEGFPRNFAPVWQKFPQYTQENTLMISNYFNCHEEFHRNDLVVPLYDPKLGKTDFLDDKHLAWAHGYLGFLASLES